MDPVHTQVFTPFTFLYPVSVIELVMWRVVGRAHDVHVPSQRVHRNTHLGHALKGEGYKKLTGMLVYVLYSWTYHMHVHHFIPPTHIGSRFKGVHGVHGEGQ